MNGKKLILAIVAVGFTISLAGTSSVSAATSSPSGPYIWSVKRVVQHSGSIGWYQETHGPYDTYQQALAKKQQLDQQADTATIWYADAVIVRIDNPHFLQSPQSYSPYDQLQFYFSWN